MGVPDDCDKEVHRDGMLISLRLHTPVPLFVLVFVLVSYMDTHSASDILRHRQKEVSDVCVISFQWISSSKMNTVTTSLYISFLFKSVYNILTSCYSIPRSSNYHRRRK